MATPYHLCIGTRGSLLAMAQAREARRHLVARHPQLARDGAVEIVEITTTGDRVQDRRLSEIGGKGLFSKEIDTALLDRRIDIAVHSMKDMETRVPDGISLVSVLEREDPRDVLITGRADSFDTLPAGSLIGTSSLRRQAQILNRRPDLKVGLLRGNIQTRLRKIQDRKVDATLLALAGLRRLGNTDVITEILDPDVMLPAVAQGAIGIVCRTDDARSSDFVRAINHRQTMIRVACERAMLEALDGSCHTPVGGLAEFNADGSLVLRGLVAKPDGTEIFETRRQGPPSDGVVMGRDAGEELRRRAGPGIFG